MRRIPLFWRFVIVLAAITIGYVIVASRAPQGTQTAARRQRFERETPKLFAALPIPPDATPHAPRSQKMVELRGRFGVVVDQELVRPGAFAATDAFYQRELPARGWIEYDHSSVDRKYCKAPYTLIVEQAATFEDSHRFALHLTYDDQKRGTWKCDVP